MVSSFGIVAVQDKGLRLKIFFISAFSYAVVLEMWAIEGKKALVVLMETGNIMK